MEERKHLSHYLVLVLGLCAGLISFLLFRYDSSIQMYSIVGMVAFYILWGIIHHYLEDRVTPHIVWEYILLGCVILLLYSLVLRV